jgi:hypothetical protein
MKKLLVIFIFIFVLSLPAHADTTEKVRVIKFDKDTHDLIVERINGERLLLQHHYTCSSMTTEFPVYLIWEGDQITRLKVDWNEICKVHNFGPYSGDITIEKRIKSENLLVADHLAHIIWKNRRYKIDYGEGCEDLRNFIDRTAYISTSDIENAMLYLPEDRGQCQIKTAEFLGYTEAPNYEIESPITNLQHKAENNEAYFYWDFYEGDKKWVYLISRSRFQLNPDDYQWDEMPFLRYTKENSYTAKTLTNGRTYYFYLSARDEDGNVAPWIELEITPVLTSHVFKNNPDQEEFEIEITDNESDYLLQWPDKSENSKRYLIQFFVNGKRELLKIISGEINEYIISKKPEYQGVNFRFTVQSIPKNIYGTRYSDGVYWEFE